MRKGFLAATAAVLSGLPGFAQQPSGVSTRVISSTPPLPAYYSSGASAPYLPRAFFPDAAGPAVQPMPTQPMPTQSIQAPAANSVAVIPPHAGDNRSPRLFRPASTSAAPAFVSPSIAVAPAAPAVPNARTSDAPGALRPFLPKMFFPTAGPANAELLPAPRGGVIVTRPHADSGPAETGPIAVGPPVIVSGPAALGAAAQPYGYPQPLGYPQPYAYPGYGIADPLTPPEEFHRPHERCWIGADYLLAWIRRGPLSTPLLTTSTSTDPDVDRGALDEPGTAVLFGNDDLSFGAFSGFRLDGGLWLDEDNHYSVDAAFFWLAPRSTGVDVRSNGTTLLGRPVFNVAPGQFDEDVFLIADSDPTGPTLAGAMNIDARSQLYGGELNSRWHCCGRKHFRGDALIGFRSMHLGERLQITDSISSLRNDFITFKGTPVAAGDVVTEQDLFETSNTFWGVQFGGRARWENEWCYLDAFAKIGIGATCQDITIAGASTLTSNGVIIDRAQGGILALPSNIGEYDRTRLGVIPEVGLNLGIALTDHVRFRAGYSFLVWNQVARPGQQLDRSINTGQVPADQEFGNVDGVNRPRTPLGESLLWMQTLNFGLEVHY